MDRLLNINTEKPYIVVGDIHGCFEEFKELIKIVDETYGKDNLIISVGDTIDRGDYSIETLRLCLELYKKGRYYEVKSNHLDKFVRWLKGSNVNISYGMQKTVNQFLALNKNLQEKLREEVIKFYEEIPIYMVINSKVVVAHAGIKDEFIGRTDKQVKSFVLYGQTTGRYTEKGFPERVDWTKERKISENSPKIIYGHVVYDEPYINNNCYGIDTGACLGNKLTGYVPMEDRFIFVKSKRVYYKFED
ncbi:MAG: metallophosphoesterase [Hydrogenothermaceae bacterium]